MTENKNPLEGMLVPFSPHEINTIPKGGINLDYVGHAALTKRLLQTDLTWTWEPVAFDELGLPRLDKNGGLWIRLTVCGVTRLGYGDASGKTGGNAIKEAIGDALRNAGMRFGAALDLWHKGDLWEATESAKNDSVVIGAGVVKKNVKEAKAETFTDDEVLLASTAFDNIETIESEFELQRWYNTEAVKKLWNVPIDLTGNTIKKQTFLRLEEIRKGKSIV